MGCQPTKIKNSNQKKTKSCKTDDPAEIDCDSNDHTIIPKYQVIDQACGYLFTHHISKSSTDISTKSQAGAEDVKQILNEYDKCAYFYQQHNLDQAIQHAKNLCELLQELKKRKNISEDNIIVQEIGRQKIREMEQLIRNVQQQYHDMITFEHEIDKGGWIQKTNKKGVRICIRPEGETVGCLIQSEIETPFQILIAVLIEMDLYKQFIPFVKISVQEKEVARNCRIGYTQNHIPFLSVRQAFFQGIGYNRLQKNGSLFLLTRSIHNREDLQEKLGYKCKCTKQFVQLEYKYYVLKYEPIRRGKGKITIAMNINPRLDFLPMWILEKVSGDFGQDFLKNVLKISSRFEGSKWEENVKKNPHLFNFFKDAIDEYVTKMEKEQEKQKEKEK